MPRRSFRLDLKKREFQAKWKFWETNLKQIRKRIACKETSNESPFSPHAISNSISSCVANDGRRKPVVVMKKLPDACQLGSPVSLNSLSSLNFPEKSPRSLEFKVRDFSFDGNSTNACSMLVNDKDINMVNSKTNCGKWKDDHDCGVDSYLEPNNLVSKNLELIKNDCISYHHNSSMFETCTRRNEIHPNAGLFSTENRRENEVTETACHQTVDVDLCQSLSVFEMSKVATETAARNCTIQDQMCSMDAVSNFKQTKDTVDNSDKLSMPSFKPNARKRPKKDCINKQAKKQKYKQKDCISKQPKKKKRRPSSNDASKPSVTGSKKKPVQYQVMSTKNKKNGVKMIMEVAEPRKEIKCTSLYKCRFCPFKTRDKATKQDHARHCYPYRCPSCQRRFSVLELFEAHKTLCAEENYQQCFVCETRFHKHRKRQHFHGQTHRLLIRFARKAIREIQQCGNLDRVFSSGTCDITSQCEKCHPQNESEIQMADDTKQGNNFDHSLGQDMTSSVLGSDEAQQAFTSSCSHNTDHPVDIAHSDSYCTADSEVVACGPSVCSLFTSETNVSYLSEEWCESHAGGNESTPCGPSMCSVSSSQVHVKYFPKESYCAVENESVAHDPCASTSQTNTNQLSKERTESCSTVGNESTSCCPGMCSVSTSQTNVSHLYEERNECIVGNESVASGPDMCSVTTSQTNVSDLPKEQAESYCTADSKFVACGLSMCNLSTSQTVVGHLPKEWSESSCSLDRDCVTSGPSMCSAATPQLNTSHLPKESSQKVGRDCDYQNGSCTTQLDSSTPMLNGFSVSEKNTECSSVFFPAKDDACISVVTRLNSSCRVTHGERRSVDNSSTDSAESGSSCSHDNTGTNTLENRSTYTEKGSSYIAENDSMFTAKTGTTFTQNGSSYISKNGSVFIENGSIYTPENTSTYMVKTGTTFTENGSTYMIENGTTFTDNDNTFMKEKGCTFTEKDNTYMTENGTNVTENGSTFMTENGSIFTADGISHRTENDSIFTAENGTAFTENGSTYMSEYCSTFTDLRRFLEECDLSSDDVNYQW